MLVNFLEENQQKLMNSFFHKKADRKWTWISPDGQTKNEIDFIITNRTDIIQDVTVLNNIHVSDHRFVRAKININLKHERRKLLSSQRRMKDVERIQQREEVYRMNLESILTHDIQNFNEVSQLSNYISDSIKKAVEKTLPVDRKTASNNKISEDTKKLIADRNKHKISMTHVELKERNKLIRNKVRADVSKYNERIIREVIEDNKGTKVFKKKISPGKSEITLLKDENGNKLKTRTEILEYLKRFYEDLYSTKVSQKPHDKTDKRAKLTKHYTEDLPPISKYEIKSALKKMKNNKAPGPDDIIIEYVKMGGPKLLGYLEKLFNDCLDKGEIPQAWKNADVIILYKKGDREDIKNYRPISLLSHTYKLLTRIITNRVTNKLDQFQPVEQAGFRGGYSTIDHIHTVRQIIEKSQEYNQQVFLAFIDFEKAFDTIEKWAFMNSLRRCRIDSRYIQLINALYHDATMTVKIFGETDPITLWRGVRQGDTISPKIFTTALEDVFKTLEWEAKGVNINGEQPSLCGRYCASCREYG